MSVLLLALGAGQALAQTPVIQPLLTSQRLICAQAVDGRLYAGLEKGGLVEYDPASGQPQRTLTRRDGLGGHNVRDLALIDQTLWVATLDGGLTAITNPGTANESMRVYSSLLASLAVTAVTGQIVGTTDRIYYGTLSNGIGVITGGLPGAYLTVQDGLIDDQIDELAVTDDNLLLIATPSGLSRFAENTFTNYPYADAASERVNDLELGPDGRIWAATRSGVKRWNDETRSLEPVFGSSSFNNLAVDGPRVWALTSFEAVWLLQGESSTRQDLAPAPQGQQVITEAIAAAGGVAWTVGRMRPEGWVAAGSLVSFPFILPVGDATAAHDVLDGCPIGAQGGFAGVAIDSRRRAWLGDFAADGLAGYDDGQWYNVNQLATEDNDFNGFFDWDGNVLAMARDGDALWFNQFQRGVIRFQPAAQPGGEESWDLIDTGNSGMRGRFIVNIAVHPDGPVFFTTDGNEPDLGVDILIDPDNWQSPESWLHLEPSVLGGNNIWAVGFERRDVVWFAVRDVGLQRWDINGPGAGPGDPLTWADTSDDQWLLEPLQFVPGSEYAFDIVNALVTGPDGSLWVGGSGLVNFRYEPILQTATLLGQWGAKTSPFAAGLLAQTVSGLGFDRHGDLWALTSAGLNRLRLNQPQVPIDAYTDLGTFLTLDPSFYSPAVIAPLPGGTYRRLDMAADGSRLVISSDLGGVQVDVPLSAGESTGSLETVYLYPNPFPGDSGTAQLNLGGLELGADQTVSVEILNLAGEVVHLASERPGIVDLWDGRNRQGRRVSAGMYLVKVTLADRVVVKTLAVNY